MRRSLPIWLLAGCAVDNVQFVQPLPLIDDLTPLLSPSAVVVTTETGGFTRGNLWLHPLDDGGAAGVLWRGLVTVDATGGTFSVTPTWLFRTTPDGTTRVASIDGSQAQVPLGDELFLAGCQQSGLTDAAEVYVPFSRTFGAGVPETCGGTFGPGASGDRVVRVDPVAGQAFLHALDRAARTETVTALPAPPAVPSASGIRYVFEPSVGTLLLVVESDARALSLVDEAGATVPITGVDGDLGVNPAWLGSDGRLRLTTAEGLYRVDPDTGEAERLAPVPPAPPGSSWVEGSWRGGAYAEGGEPNPGAPDYLIPSTMAVRYATDSGGFEIVEPPLTPCCDPDACRLYGESYLLGGIGDVLVYDLWSWEGDDEAFTHVEVVRPVEDPCPGAEN